MDADAHGPPLPRGRRVHLPGRGTTFYREVEGPPGGPTVVLNHGWIASAGLNWFRVFEPLGRHARIIAMDHRGHGRGIRSRRHFRLSDCADDAAALCHHLEIERVIAVGYSMGGPMTQMMWKRHPGLVAGMVLGASFDRIAFGSRSRLVFGTMMVAAAGVSGTTSQLTRVPAGLARVVGPHRPYDRPANLRDWAVQEMRRHDWTTVMQAGVALSRFSSTKWLRDVDVPTAVLVTTADRAVLPERQRRMAAEIPGAEIHEWDGGHADIGRSDFGDAITAAVCSVADRLGYPTGPLQAAG